MRSAFSGRTLAQLQGWFYLLSGLWPLLSERTFQTVTGFKADFWLAQTVGALLAVSGVAMIRAGRTGRVTLEIAWLAAGQAAALAVIDLYCISQPRTTSAYWLDVPVEIAFVLAWLFLRPRVRRHSATVSRSAAAVVFGGISFLSSPGTLFPGEPDYALYVSNERSGDVTVIDGPTLAVVRTLPVGKRPRGIHLTPDGQHLLVATSGSPRLGPGVDPDRAKSLTADKSADGIAVIDLARGEVTRRLSVGSDPEEFALSPDGQHVLVSNEDVASASLWDFASGRAMASASVSDEPEGVTWRPDGALAYVACEQEGEIVVLDATAAVIARIALGGRPRSITFAPDGERAYVPLEAGQAIAVIDARQHRLLKRVPLGEEVFPMASALSPDGRELYVSTGRGNRVLVIDLAHDAVVATIPVGRRPWGLRLSPDGQRLFTANGQSDDISVIDVATRKELTRIKAGAGPWGLAIRYKSSNR